jgi:peptidyl-tRNA hydrolase, PTH2 family
MMHFGFPSSGDEEFKAVILMRNDLKMTKGKMAAQASHAAVSCAFAAKKNMPKAFDSWSSTGQKIVVLKIDSEKELFDFKAMADHQNIINSVVQDAGRTEVEPGTYTCLGVGPDKASVIDKMTGELKMM